MSMVSLPRKFHVKRNDEVVVISGAQKGKSGRVLQVIRGNARVIVEGVNLRKKAIRPTQDNPKGGYEEKESPIHISNVKVTKAADNKVGGKKSKK